MVAIAAAAASAATGIAGAVSGGSGTQQQQQTSSSAAPWDQQGAALTNAYNNAANTFGNRQNTPYSQYYAPQNQTQTNALGNIYGTAQNDQSSGGYLAAINSGLGLLNQTGNYTGNANAIASNGIGQQNPQLSNLLTNYATTGQMPGMTGTNPALAQGVTAASLGGLSSLSQGQSIANQVAQQGLNSGQAMNQVVNGAGQYANSAPLQGQIDALGTDISRNLNNTTLPGIRAAAQANGNTNSSREGALEAIAGSQAQENLLNAASNIRANAYNTGGQLANSQYSTGLGAATSAANALNYGGATAGSLANTQQSMQNQASQFDTSARLGAANNQQSQNLGYNTANAQAMLSGNQQLGTGLLYGTGALNTGLTGQMTDAQAMLGAGTAQQQLDQSALTAQDTRQQNVLNDYFNIVSRGYNGANSTTGTNNVTGGGGLSGALQGGIGGLTAGYGAVQNLTGNSDPFGLKNSLWNATNGNSWGGTSGGAGTSTLQGLGLFNPIS